MLDLKVSTNIKGLQKRLKDIENNQIPFAMSGAMRDTVKSAADKAAEGAKSAFDRPTPNIFKKPSNRKTGNGMVRYQFDSKKQIKAKGNNKAEASVFIIKHLVEEIHPQVFGGRVSSQPEGTKGILTPTRAVIKGLLGRGRLRQLNKYGNITNLHKRALKEAKSKTEFVNVPLFSAASSHRRLKPGLYIRVFKDTKKTYTAKYRDSARQRRANQKRDSRGRFERVDGTRRTTLVMLIAYETSRTYKKKYKFDQIVMREYEAVFELDFRKKLKKAIETAKVR